MKVSSEKRLAVLIKAKADMKTALPIVLVIGLGACASSKEVAIAAGERGYSIDCSGDMLDWSLCYQEAGQICGRKGFEIVDKTGGTGIVIAGIRYGVYGEPGENRSMIIKCRRHPESPMTAEGQ